jgi:DNA-directed RNA polymerase sigma subunit (sigma70/sigma32)
MRYRDEMSNAEFNRAIEKLNLSVKARIIGWEYLVLGRSLRETAALNNVSRERVRQIVARITRGGE